MGCLGVGGWVESRVNGGKGRCESGKVEVEEMIDCHLSGCRNLLSKVSMVSLPLWSRTSS